MKSDLIIQLEFNGIDLKRIDALVSRIEEIKALEQRMTAERNTPFSELTLDAVSLFRETLQDLLALIKVA